MEEKNMATLKDVAKMANVSLSTVSIVVNGKAKERNISIETQKKVNLAIKKLDYRPNAAARHLRYALNNRPRIALFWPFDTRTTMLSAILTGINHKLEMLNFDCELVVQTYKSNHIENSTKELLENTYSGIIVGGASPKDIHFLENNCEKIPTVLLNRTSEILSTVCVPASDVADAVISLLKEREISQVMIARSNNFLTASSQRTDAVIQQCNIENIKITDANIMIAPNSYEGGIQMAKMYLDSHRDISTIFCESDMIALGMAYYFNEKNVRIPSDVALLAVGTLGMEQTKYSTPPITIVDIPSEKIAGTAINVLQEQMNNKTEALYPSQKKFIKPEIHIRKSFP
jgi:LacI family purine nucleotide synthesis repressor